MTTPKDINSTSDALGLTRSKTLWFEDCGLIIRAENKLFRVSRDALATQSSIFRDMLTLPPPQDTAELMDGCPIVRLPEPLRDVDYFLRALFDYEFFNPYPARTTFAILSGVLRMSHKYEVRGLLKRAKRARVGRTGGIPIIALARQVSADWIIPLTLYRLCREISVEDILFGVNFYDFNVRLSERDQVYALKASTFFRTDAISQILAFLWSPTKLDGCTDYPHCTLVRLEARRKAEWWRGMERDHLMPVEIWQQADLEQHLNGVCRSCLAQMKGAHKRALNVLWDKLPKLGGFSDWTELEAMRRKTLEL
ncbi:hypothetical protein C8R46DRAFT_1286811 [Mycena filopes]|nr:hypothetical protein C8R46DRAFT_1286811 [Mycena filopes]